MTCVIEDLSSRRHGLYSLEIKVVTGQGAESGKAETLHSIAILAACYWIAQ